MSNVVRLEYAYGVCPKCKRVHYLRYLIHKDGLIHKPYEIKCINCNSYFAKEDILGSGEETAPKPITNADRIRAMTDEELAYFMANIEPCRESAWLDWLKQEANDDNDDH
jgi:hypothetical protein